ncbi:MAG: ATP-binding region ATPase domain protein [Gemmatimonadetes bacterium]|nr:ATP-binding region ATPase domain protein [Gemmatimonadota bacterium]
MSSERPLLLVVDDEPVNVDLLCDLLDSLDYRAIGALGGEAALAAVREHRPDLVLMDVMMPGMNGYEVCRRLRADPATAGIPVVFVTALSETEDKVQAIDAGGDDFLTKPFNRPLLLARIRSLLRLKAAGDALEDSYRRLRDLERLKDDLVRMVVHDLKSPLTAMLGTLEMAVDGDLGPLEERQRRLLEDARRRGEDVVELIDNLLDLTRLEESSVRLELRPVDVRRLLGQVAGEWTVRAEQRGSTVSVEAAPEAVVPADETLLRRVLGNLVGNALRHAGRGVHVRLSAAAADGGVELVVADDGVGIAPELHDEIFRKGATGAPAEGGRGGSSGLGLTFCKLAAEAHGGSIRVFSGAGRGSAFQVRLPAGVPAPVP